MPEEPKGTPAVVEGANPEPNPNENAPVEQELNFGGSIVVKTSDPNVIAAHGAYKHLQGEYTRSKQTTPVKPEVNEPITTKKPEPTEDHRLDDIIERNNRMDFDSLLNNEIGRLKTAYPDVYELAGEDFEKTARNLPVATRDQILKGGSLDQLFRVTSSSKVIDGYKKPTEPAVDPAKVKAAELNKAKQGLETPPVMPDGGNSPIANTDILNQDPVDLDGARAKRIARRAAGNE